MHSWISKQKFKSKQNPTNPTKKSKYFCLNFANFWKNPGNRNQKIISVKYKIKKTCFLLFVFLLCQTEKCIIL
jgi:hypothetical protein